MKLNLFSFLAMSKKDLNINRKIIQSIAQLEEDDIHQLCLLDDLQLKTLCMHVLKNNCHY